MHWSEMFTIKVTSNRYGYVYQVLKIQSKQVVTAANSREGAEAAASRLSDKLNEEMDKLILED